MRTWQRIAGVAMVAALATWGCASAPEAEKKAAEDALKAASTAGAEKYASADLKAAQDAAKEGDTQVQAKKYDVAKAAYVKAKQRADQAAKGVEAGKAKAKAEVEQAAADVEKRWTELEEKAKALVKRLKPEQTQAWAADGKTVKDTVEAAKAAAATDPLEAKDKVASVNSTLEKWTADLEALAATPVMAPAVAKTPAKKK